MLADNNSTDRTAERRGRRRRDAWASTTGERFEPEPGKYHALNRALGTIDDADRPHRWTPTRSSKREALSHLIARADEPAAGPPRLRRSPARSIADNATRNFLTRMQ